MALKLKPPTTATGVEMTIEYVPLPSMPKESSPQQ